MKRIILSILSAIAVLPMSAQTLDGSWTGKLNVGQMSLTLVLNINKDAMGQTVCTMDSPDQGANIAIMLGGSKGVEYRSIEETISPEVMKDIAEWINSQK